MSSVVFNNAKKTRQDQNFYDFLNFLNIIIVTTDILLYKTAKEQIRLAITRKTMTRQEL